MKKIIIIGGGISGLTAAFELVEQGYEIIIIERNDIVGGLARTYQDENNKVCPYEYSWRAYGRGYQNVYNIMKRIPVNDKETVYDTLVILEGGKLTCDKKIKNYTEQFNTISFPINVILTFLKYLFSCDERNRENFGKIGLKEFITANNLSKEIVDTIGKFVGPYLGFDYHYASLYDLLYFYEMYLNNSSEYNFNITSSLNRLIYSTGNKKSKKYTTDFICNRSGL
jgi:predicted NAD/FAD-binding protein